jgi:copper homeostasis protein CutC
MAGGGLQLTNLAEVVRRTGVRHLHGSLNRRGSEDGKPNHDSASNGHPVANAVAVLECDVRESVRLLLREFKTREALR